MSIPDIDRTKEVRTGKRARGRGYPERTIENWGKEVPGEIGLLYNVHSVRDLWGIRIIGPGLEPKVRHELGMYTEEGLWWRAGSRVGKGNQRELPFRGEGDAWSL